LIEKAERAENGSRGQQMLNPTAQKIIDAMNKPDVYRQMMLAEAAVWSKEFHADPRADIRRAEDEAGNRLGCSRTMLRLKDLLIKHGLSPRHGLSLGCGAGRAERHLLKIGVCGSFVGIDVAEWAIEEARSLAKRESCNCTYEIQDLNYINLPPQAYDLVVAQTSLHHVLRIEHVLDQVQRTLTSSGVFWVVDYVGESQFQFTNERLEIMNELLALLPEKFRRDRLHERVLKPFSRPEVGRLASPFESIRSGEIRELLLSRFEVIEMHEETTFLHRVVPIGTRQNYVENDETITVFNVLKYFDELLARKGLLAPVAGQYLLRAK
jgi:ubiquinone/menaquinone biosynthesis C-methylase UbiE